MSKIVADAVEKLRTANKARVDYEAETNRLVRELIDSRKDGLRALMTAEGEAEQAHSAARSSVVKPHEWEGKKVVRTRRRPVGPFTSRDETYEEFGIVETVKMGAKFKTNLAYWSLPSIGEVIVRELKKDGTPALGFRRLDANWKLAE